MCVCVCVCVGVCGCVYVWWGVGDETHSEVYYLCFRTHDTRTHKPTDKLVWRSARSGVPRRTVTESVRWT